MVDRRSAASSPFLSQAQRGQAAESLIPSATWVRPLAGRHPLAVIILSGSSKDAIGNAYAHADAYLQKPLDLEGLVEAVKLIEAVWLSGRSLAGES